MLVLPGRVSLCALCGVWFVLSLTISAARPAVGAPEVIPLPAGKPITAITFSSEDETELLVLLNHTREAHQLPPLANDRVLTTAARIHSRDMALHRYLGHGSSNGESFMDRMATFVPSKTLFGENVAVAQTIERVNDAFRASPAHLRNMLDPRFRRVGIGIVVAGALGLIVTEDFSE